MAKGKTALLPEEAKRADVYREMTGDLKTVAKTLDEMDQRSSRGFVMLRYDMGAALKPVFAEGAKYGSNAVKQLAVFLGKTPTELYTLNAIATKWTRSEVDGLLKRKMGMGGYIGWQHLAEIVVIDKVPDRRKMIDKVFNDSLSSAQISHIVKSENLSKGTRGFGGGRKPTPPENPLAAYQQIYSQALEFNNRVEGWESKGMDVIDEIAPESVTTIMLEKVTLALEQSETMVKNVNDVHERLSKNKERIEAILTQQQVDAEAAQAEAAAAPAEGAESTDEKPKGKGRRRPAAAAATA